MSALQHLDSLCCTDSKMVFIVYNKCILQYLDKPVGLLSRNGAMGEFVLQAEKINSYNRNLVVEQTHSIQRNKSAEESLIHSCCLKII